MSYFAIYAGRNVFSTPSHSHIIDLESGGACGEVISKEGAASGRLLPKSIATESGSSLLERDSSASASKQPVPNQISGTVTLI